MFEEYASPKAKTLNIDRFKKEFQKLYEYVDKCSEEDCEANLAGNGINSCEAMRTLWAVKELVDKLN